MTKEWERLRALEDRWAKECEERHAISRELISKARGKSVKSFDIDQEHRRRMVARGETMLGDDQEACALLGLISASRPAGTRGAGGEAPALGVVFGLDTSNVGERGAGEAPAPGEFKFVWDTSPKPFDEVAAKMKADAEASSQTFGGRDARLVRQRRRIWRTRLLRELRVLPRYERRSRRCSRSSTRWRSSRLRLGGCSRRAIRIRLRTATGSRSPRAS